VSVKASKRKKTTKKASNKNRPKRTKNKNIKEADDGTRDLKDSRMDRLEPSFAELTNEGYSKI
jgi:hypothetical protein